MNYVFFNFSVMIEEGSIIVFIYININVFKKRFNGLFRLIFILFLLLLKYIKILYC